MNLVECYVTNIIHIGERSQYGFHEITADFDCYGRVEKQVTKRLYFTQIEQIKKYGYYMC